MKEVKIKRTDTLYDFTNIKYEKRQNSSTLSEVRKKAEGRPG